MDHGISAIRQALFEIEDDLPLLLRAPVESWRSVFVDYETPHVDRLWRAWGKDHRIYLHRIYPCSDALYHPHPWPSAMRILAGQYTMGVGHSSTDQPPTKDAATLTIGPGTVYDMTDPDGWHYVKPQPGGVVTLMVTGAPWGRWSPKPPEGYQHGPLPRDRALSLYETFRRYFPEKDPYR